jgi:acetyl esterase/lipase
MSRNAFAAIGVLGCGFAMFVQERQLPPGGARVTRDIVFATTLAKELKLDLYLPAVSKAPLVVWIHGGAWRTGSRHPTPAAFLTERGFAVASISYRLSQEAIFPAQIQDCKAAIRWLRANAAGYGYDASRIGVWGASAGGHLAALLGTSGEVKELEGDSGYPEQSSRVQAVVDFFGPTDLTRMSRFTSQVDHDSPDSPESQLVGGPIQQNQQTAASANPIRYITNRTAPFLIVHGDADPLVPVNQSELLDTALRQEQVPVEFLVLSGAGHGGPQFLAPEMLDRITRFFRKHLQ